MINATRKVVNTMHSNYLDEDIPITPQYYININGFVDETEQIIILDRIRQVIAKYETEANKK